MYVWLYVFLDSLVLVYVDVMVMSYAKIMT